MANKSAVPELYLRWIKATEPPGLVKRPRCLFFKRNNWSIGDMEFA